MRTVSFLFIWILSHGTVGAQYVYGTTKMGGTFGGGTLFVFDLSSSQLSTVFEFQQSETGSNPTAGITVASDSSFYGLCPIGGAFGGGTIFKITNKGVFIKLRDLSNADGMNPRGGLVQGRDGKLYGLCVFGGANGGGTIFSVALDGTFQKLKDLSVSDGLNPMGTLVQGPGGKLYGTASEGGANQEGTFFSMDTLGTFTTLHDFSLVADGETPACTLAKGSDGNFYGQCPTGGNFSSGTLFQVTPSGKFTVIHHNQNGDGIFTSDGLTEGNDGFLYGVAGSAGASDNSLVFKVSSTGTYSVLQTLDPTAHGSLPLSRLTEGVDGALYGTCFTGGAAGSGTLFRITKTGTLSKLFNFDGTNNGANPMGSLIFYNRLLPAVKAPVITSLPETGHSPSLYPNPAAQGATAYNAKGFPYGLTVLGANGAIVKILPPTDEPSLQVNGLVPGVYILQAPGFTMRLEVL